MQKDFFRNLILIAIGFQLSAIVRLQADADVYWDFDSGFYPSAVVINPGEKVTWWNIDPYGFGVQITIGGSLSFYLRNYTGQGVIFPDAGTYGFQSNFGESGSVTVTQPPAPALTLESPRLVNGQFLFEATGLTTGKANVLMASTDLTNWTAIKTNVATGNSMTFTNAPGPDRRFFRVIEQP